MLPPYSRPVPPGPSTQRMIQNLFPAPLSDSEQAAFTRALEVANGVPAKQRLRVTPRLVCEQLRALRPAAGPGPSGYRNTHIVSLASDHSGIQSLVAWADLWASGKISPWLAKLWTGALARPFWKSPEQSAIRPVLCGEGLLKFAMGVCVRGSLQQVRAAVGAHQFGVSGGPSKSSLK